MSPFVTRPTVSVCRFCRKSIWFEAVIEPGFRPRHGWSDRAASDALVCFRARDLTHEPNMEDTE